MSKMDKNLQRLFERKQQYLHILKENPSERSEISILKRKIELNQAIDKLEATQKLTAKREEILEKRKKRFEEKQKEMAAQVQNFENFILDNDKKFEQASETVRGEYEKQNRKREELHELKAVLEERISMKDQILNKLKKLLQYKKFASLLDEDIEVISERADMFITANDTLQKELIEFATQKERLQEEVLSALSDITMHNLTSFKEIQSLQDQLRSVSAKSKQEQNGKRLQAQQIVETKRDKGKIMMGIRCVN